MKHWNRKRLWLSIRKCSILLGIGIAYLIFTKTTGWGIRCVIHQITRKYCPGCGITRMFVALASLDFQKAFQSNALVLVGMPFAIGFGLRRWLIWLKTGETEPDLPEKIALIIASLLTAVFWILRNTESFSWLAPH